ncbi:MAG: cupin domain-containing protein [Mucispirillum sp.]|nr:cupin domain-containing protein [Mucispirillum sp.]
MVTKFNEIKSIDVTAPRGGKGTGKSSPYNMLYNLDGKIKALNKMRLDDNSAIGIHQHTEDLEIYIITDGEGLYNDNGVEVRVTKGDATMCPKGEIHSIEAKNGALEFIAVIIEER